MPLRNLSNFSVEISQLILKFTWNWKGPRMVRTILKNNKVEGLTSGHLNLLQSSNNQACGRVTRMDPCNTTENPEVNPYVLQATDFQQKRQDHPTRKGDFSTQAPNNGRATSQRMKGKPDLIPDTEINSKWMRAMPIHPLEEHIVVTLPDFGFGVN